MAFYLSFFFFFTISSVFACDRCVHQSKVTPFSTNSPISSGACGYGSSAISFNNAQLAAAVSSLYKNGAGCGACFQMRCKNKKLCTRTGTRVVVTDLNKNNQTDFAVSSRAFMSMANKGMAKDILKLEIVDVEYKRVPCDYNDKKLTVRIEESSRKPNYLAIKFLFQGGQTEMVGVDVCQVGLANWRFMSRKYGAVWETSSVPNGALQFRIMVTSGYDGKQIWAKNVLPPDWRVGVTYDAGVQIDDIAQEGCLPCDDETWK